MLNMCVSVCKCVYAYAIVCVHMRACKQHVCVCVYAQYSFVCACVCDSEG